MKTHIIILSQQFTATHPRKGEPTGFEHKVIAAVSGWDDHWLKIHTIRANYELWRKRFEQIERGEACLSVRKWARLPYRSKQIEIARLTKEDGIGLQKVSFPYGKLNMPAVDTYVNAKSMAANDGLYYDDWEAWLKSYNLSKPLAIIHFTKFRY